MSLRPRFAGDGLLRLPAKVSVGRLQYGLTDVLAYGGSLGEETYDPFERVASGLLLAEDFAFGDGQAEWMANVLMPEAGLRFDPDVHRRVQLAGRQLRAVASNAALLYHRDGRSEREVVQYLEHYGLMTEPEAAKRFSFISDPLWRPYIFTYSVGRQLLSGWLDRVEGDDRLARFRQLLTEQVTPSQIAARA